MGKGVALTSNDGDEMQGMWIGKCRVGVDRHTYIIAEISANHGGNFEEACELVRSAADAGADAVKIQMYRAESMAGAWAGPEWRAPDGTLWAGERLVELYRRAETPWEWLELLQARAEERGIVCFPSVFDRDGVHFAAERGVPALKIAGFEVVDLSLIRAAAETGIPILMSTGMATIEEIDLAVTTIREGGGTKVGLLRGNNAYPALPEEMDLRTIGDMRARWNVPVGLSDHTPGIAVAVAAVAMGASIIEKHLTRDRQLATLDGEFSLEPAEFESMVKAIRIAERAFGSIRYGASEHERVSARLRRSLFVVEDVRAGEVFTEARVRSLRSSLGMEPRYLERVLGRTAREDVVAGTPMSWDLLDGGAG